ncbi:MAG: hypothetical protein LBE22_11885 [Azoarcus sp.]|nr:hypothetical protein [Azoarcus sp.]
MSLALTPCPTALTSARRKQEKIAVTRIRHLSKQGFGILLHELEPCAGQPEQSPNKYAPLYAV